MSDEANTPMTPLDTMVSQDSLQVLKAAIPYMSGKSQQLFSVYAKMMELTNTISFFRRPQPELAMMSEKPQSMQPADMLSDVRRFAHGPMKDQIDQLLFALNTVQLIQMYQENPES